jgi:aerotolerance regulator-like protein/VWA domain-containing protein
MGLLAPLFLGGLAAVGVPIYLHLLRRHSTTPKPFSSLMFFEPRTQSSIRHRRLRYLLLLSLRLLVLVAIAVAFADPFISRPAASVPAEKLVLLVIDRSFSMRAGTRMDDAKREALAVLASRRASQRAQVMAFSSELHVLTQPTEDAGALRAAVTSIAPDDSRGSLGELATAVRQVADNARTPIELHLFSDMQRSNMTSSFSEMVLPDTVTLMLHPVAKAAVPNWTVESVTAPGQLWGNAKGAKPPRVQAVVTGYATPAADRIVSLVVNGKTIATQMVRVPAGGRASVEFASLDVPYGFSRCVVSIDSADALRADDAYSFTVERSDPQSVLFVHAAADARSPLYFESALASAAGSAFTVQTAPLDQAAGLPLRKYAFVVLSNLPALPASFENELLAYARGGGGVLVAIGTAAAGRSRVPVLGDAVQQVHDYSRELSGGERFVTVGENDPSESEMGKRENWAGVKFYYATQVDEANGRVIARLTDRTPVLLDRKMGEGRGLLFTSGFDNLGNDFPLHPAFVAFVDQAARYLSGTERRSVARQVDSYLDLRTAREGEAASTSGVEIVDPQGRRPLSLREAATAQSFRLSDAGFYQVRLASGRQDVVGVNPDRRESNLDVIPADVLALWQGKGPRTQPSAAAVPASEGTEPYPLWWYIMAFALLAALSESWLASRYLGTPHEES